MYFLKNFIEVWLIYKVVLYQKKHFLSTRWSKYFEYYQRDWLPAYLYSHILVLFDYFTALTITRNRKLKDTHRKDVKLNKGNLILNGIGKARKGSCHALPFTAICRPQTEREVLGIFNRKTTALLASGRKEAFLLAWGQPSQWKATTPSTPRLFAYNK